MDAHAVRFLIRRGIQTGRLPHDRISRVSWGPSSGESCDACGELLTRLQVLLKGITHIGSPPTQFHVQCFQIWNAERCITTQLVDRRDRYTF
jgi:hypothetical protein